MPPKSSRGASPGGKGGRRLERNASQRTAVPDAAENPEADAAHEAMMLEHQQQLQDAESEESVHRQRHEALEAVARKVIDIEWLKVVEPLQYLRQTKPCASDEVAANKVVVKLMTCNRAMKPFCVSVPLPPSESELEALTLAELKQRVFEAAKTNFVDPVMLPLVQPHMQVLYNRAGKQIGRVDDVAAMERWIAAHPPPTKKLSAAEKAALPVPPPMPTIESPDACVQQFGVEPGETIYLGIRVAAPSVIGSDPNAEAEERPPILATPPVNPKEKVQLQKKPNSAAASGDGGKSATMSSTLRSKK